jgi:hypothetical protein
MDHSAWKKALELYMSAPELLAASIVVGIAIFAFAWWLRSHIAKERFELIRAQLDELNAKLADGNKKILELEKRIAVGAKPTELSANVVSTARLLRDMQIIINNIGVRRWRPPKQRNNTSPNDAS